MERIYKEVKRIRQLKERCVLCLTSLLRGVSISFKFWWYNLCLQ